jgi:tetratricopeptide (TPR) repeat protein
MAGRGDPAASRGYNALAQIAKARGEHTRVLELLEEAERLGQRLGNPYWLKFIQAQLIEIIWMTGRWDEALRRTDQFLGESRPGSPHVVDPWVRQMRAAALIARDDEEGALDDIAKALTLARKDDEPDRLLMDLGNTIRLYVELGQIDRAQALTEEVRSHKPDLVARYALFCLALHKEALGLTNHDLEVYFVPERADAQRDAQGLRQPLPASGRTSTFWFQVCRLIVAGDLERLTDLAAKRGDFQLEAEVRLRAAKQALHEGRHEEAAAQADKALTFYRSVGATRYIREAETLLAASPLETAPPTPQPRA